MEQSEDEVEIETPATKRARVDDSATRTSKKAGSAKEEKKKKNRMVLKPEQKRLAMIIAAVNAVQMSLIY